MTAKEFIEKKFFKGYPQHESDYIGDQRLKDIELLMNQYTRHIAEQAVEKVISERYLGVEVANINIFAGHILREIGLITNDKLKTNNQSIQ